MPETREITVYRVQELTGKARDRALQWLAEGATTFEWWDTTIEDAVTVAGLLGIVTDTEQVQFSGFSSQGDGASFTGTYYHKAGAVKAVKAYAPQDAELHRIVRALAAIQRRNGYKLTAAITRDTSSYAHEHTVTVETEMDTATPREPVEGDGGNRGALADALRAFMRWTYRQLESEYEYRTSEEALLENADANEYRFTADGRVA